MDILYVTALIDIALIIGMGDSGDGTYMGVRCTGTNSLIQNNILKRMNFEGEVLTDRLDKLTSATLSNLEQVREAHKIRNSIIHNPDYKLSFEEAKRVLGIYEQAFRDLELF